MKDRAAQKEIHPVRSLATKGVLFVALPLLGVLAATIGGVWSGSNADTVGDWVAQSVEIRTEVRELRRRVSELRVAVQQSDESAPRVRLEEVAPLSEAVGTQFAKVSRLLRDSQGQEVLRDEALREFDLAKQQLSGGTAGADVEPHLKEIARLLDMIIAAEDEQLLRNIAHSADHRNQALWFLYSASGIGLLGGLLVGYGFIHRNLVRRITILAERARSMDEDLGTSLGSFGDDEIGRLHDQLLSAFRIAGDREREVAASRRLFRSVVDQMDSALSIKDANDQLLFVNRKFGQLFGLSPEQAVGKSLCDFIPREQAEEFRARDRDAQAAGDWSSTEEEIVLGDGPRTFIATRFALPESDGDPARMVCMRTDITPQKQLLSELRHAHEMLEVRVVERTAELATTNDALRRQVEERLAAERGLQRQSQRLELLNQITRAIAARHDLASLFRTVLSHLLEEFDIDLGVLYYLDDASDILIVGAAIERVPGLLAKANIERGSLIQVGANGIRECIGGTTVAVDDLHAAGEGLFSKMGQAGLAVAAAAPLRGSDTTLGLIVVSRLSNQPFGPDDRGFLTQVGEHVALAVMQLRLLDDLRRTLEDLRVTQEQMIQQERLSALGQLASGVAHDINNSLGPITLYCEMLQSNPSLDDETRRRLVLIRRAAEGIATTVVRLQQFYRPTLDTMPSHQIRINDLLREVVELSRPRWHDVMQATGATIKFVEEFSESLPELFGSMGELRNALLNLVINALDAMPSGGTLRLGTRVTEGEVEIEIEDSGVGMSPETVRRCLEPFYTTKGEKGSGLGLPMVYGVIQRHGGRIEIESEIGRGTRMRVMLPIAHSANSILAKAAPALRPTRQLRILCVDDDPAVLEALEAVLQTDGHTTRACNSGAAAIEACRTAAATGLMFDLMITDLGMPNMDGQELARRVRLEWPSLPAILLTGWGAQLQDQAPTVMGFSAILAKPPRLAELRAAIVNALEHS